jgi:hypothetical protein
MAVVGAINQDASHTGENVLCSEPAEISCGRFKLRLFDKTALMDSIS